MVVVVGALDQAGVPMTSILAALGAAGLAIALALRDSLSNLAAGVMLILLKPFRAGDLIGIAGQTGKVESLRLMHTVLLTPDNCELILPNNKVASEAILNYTARNTRRLLLDGGRLQVAGSTTLAASRGIALGASGAVLDIAAGAAVAYNGALADLADMQLDRLREGEAQGFAVGIGVLADDGLDALAHRTQLPRQPLVGGDDRRVVWATHPLGDFRVTVRRVLAAEVDADRPRQDHPLVPSLAHQLHRIHAHAAADLGVDRINRKRPPRSRRRSMIWVRQSLRLAGSQRRTRFSACTRAV